MRLTIQGPSVELGLRARQDTLPAGDSRLKHAVVTSHFGPRRAHFPGWTRLSDLGARIVADALARLLDRTAERAGRLLGATEAQAPLWSTEVEDAAQDLGSLAVGDDPEACAEANAWWTAFEAQAEGEPFEEPQVEDFK